jgi:hypothetical protein
MIIEAILFVSFVIVSGVVIVKVDEWLHGLNIKGRGQR